MKIIASYLGGSIAYGLDTPESDKDERFVFLNTEVKDIIGLSRHDDQVTQNSSEDKCDFEIRRFFQLLKKTNTQVLELLFNENWIVLDERFKTDILDNKFEFLDTEYVYKSIMGYIQGERRLMSGERTGRLGGKRKSALDEYGYSYKNFVQAVRLCFCAITFLKKDIFQFR